MGESIDLRASKIGAVLNTSSGTCNEESEAEMQSIFDDAGLAVTKMWCGGSHELSSAFEEMDALALDVLVVLGGDGTIRSAADRSTTHSPYLIPLPGGTMNILPKAVYGDHSWQEILKSVLERPKTKSISGGMVGSERFFITGIFGAPALWAKAREAIREGDVGGALHHSKVALDTMFAAKVSYEFNESTTGIAEALTVTCPLVATTLNDDWQVFEAAAIEIDDAVQALGLATSAAFGSWRTDQNITITRTQKVQVHSETDIPVILDGETIEAGKDIEVTFLPDAFNVLVPEPNEVLS